MNLLQVIPMPIPINTNGGGITTSDAVALFIVFGVLVFLPSVVWLVVDWIKMKKKWGTHFVDWWDVHAPCLPQILFVIYLMLLVLTSLVSLAFKLSELL